MGGVESAIIFAVLEKSYAYNGLQSSLKRSIQLTSSLHTTSIHDHVPLFKKMEMFSSKQVNILSPQSVAE